MQKEAQQYIILYDYINTDFTIYEKILHFFGQRLIKDVFSTKKIDHFMRYSNK